jgi:feruloyl esterase
MSQHTSIDGFLSRIALRRLAMAASMVIAVSAFPLAAWLLAPVQAAPVLAAATCESLASLKLPDTTITTAETVSPGAANQDAGGRGARGGRGGGQAADLPPYCKVAATLKPSSDSDIKIEVWLPAASTWNGKFQAVGNGGWNGNIDAGALGTALRRGYAAAATDTGHQGGSASFALGHPEKVKDFGYRAVHEMAVKGKAIVDAYYGSAPRYSYFVGCSAGGRQALKEAQQFPEDFNGVVAGSPGANWTGRALLSVWIGQAVHKDDASAIPQSKFAMVHDAALAACDANDGVKDRVIENPRTCKFDPKVIECKAGDDQANCLTPAQVETARKIYGPMINPRTKQEIASGFSPGSELGWNTMAGAQPFGLGTDLFKYIVFSDPNWDYKTFNFDSDIDKTLKADNGVMNALDPNLKPYFDRGGKVIQYHGWSDPQIAPGTSVAYYQSVVDKLGSSTVMKSHRLFMVPGMNHCQGGDGTDNFDMLAALEQWVEKGTAPDQVPASHLTNGAVTKTRPLCPYPQVASYKGTGSTDEAANFVCK